MSSLEGDVYVQTEDGNVRKAADAEVVLFRVTDELLRDRKKL